MPTNTETVIKEIPSSYVCASLRQSSRYYTAEDDDFVGDDVQAPKIAVLKSIKSYKMPVAMSSLIIRLFNFHIESH